MIEYIQTNMLLQNPKEPSTGQGTKSTKGTQIPPRHGKDALGEGKLHHLRIE